MENKASYPTASSVAGSLRSGHHCVAVDRLKRSTEKMIDPKRFSRLKFNEETETLAFSQKIKSDAFAPVGSAVKSRYSEIEVIYVPDETRAIDADWFSQRSPKSAADVLDICRIGFAKHTGEGRYKDVREEFTDLLTDRTLYSAEAENAFRQYGFPPFFEIGSIAFVRKEDAVIYGGSLEDFFHLSEHGVEIAAVGDVIEFGGNCEFDHLYESSPYE